MLKTKPQYTDIPFFLSKNSFTGDLNTVKDLNAIRQSIKNILMTMQNERPFDYFFGASLHGNIFDNYNIDLVLDIQSKISGNIRRYEQRVNLNDVRVLNDPKNNSINVIVDFYIPALGINDIITIDLLRTR